MYDLAIQMPSSETNDNPPHVSLSSTPARLKTPSRTKKVQRPGGRRVSRALTWLPNYFWQALSRRSPKGSAHLIFAIADHFEPSIIPGQGSARAPYDEQERRLEDWCRMLPQLADTYRDQEG